MSDIDVIAQRIMQGVSQSLSDLNKVVAAKNAAEEGERKRIAWEREEAFQNKEVDYKTTPMYMRLPPEQRAMVDNHFLKNGYVEEGSSKITNRNLKEASQSFMQNDATMKPFMEAAVAAAEDKLEKAYSEWSKMPERDEKEKQKKKERYEYVKSQQMDLAKLTHTQQEYLKAAELRADTQAKLAAEIAWHKEKNTTDLEIAKMRSGAENKMLAAQEAERNNRFLQAYTEQELGFKAARAKGMDEAKGDPKKMALVEETYQENMKALNAYAERMRTKDITKPLYQREFKPKETPPRTDNKGMVGGFFGPSKAATSGAYDPTGGVVATGITMPDIDLGPSNAATTGQFSDE